MRNREPTHKPLNRIMHVEIEFPEGTLDGGIRQPRLLL
jgi:hypothetical protein